MADDDVGARGVSWRNFTYILGGVVAAFTFMAIQMNSDISRLEGRVNALVEQTATKSDIENIETHLTERFEDFKEFVKETLKARNP